MRTGPPSRCAMADTWAWASPVVCLRTNSRSDEALDDLVMASRYRASSRLLLPWPFSPCIRTIPGSRSSSSVS